METKKVKATAGTIKRYGMSWYWEKERYGKKAYTAVCHVGGRCEVFGVVPDRYCYRDHWEGVWLAYSNGDRMGEYETLATAMKACQKALLKIRLEA